MAKSMSKTLAAELAARTLAVVSPANRRLALNAALGRHGFAGLPASASPPLGNSDDLAAWLSSAYAADPRS